MEMHIAALASLQANYSNNLAIYKRGREFELKPDWVTNPASGLQKS